MATTTHYFKSVLLCSILLTASITLIAQAETQNPGSAAGTYWKVRGNANTTASTAAIGATVNNNFIGTTTTEAFVLAANNMERMRLDEANFLIGIGQTAPQYAVDLKVNPDAVYPCGRNGLRILHPAYSNACNNGLFLGISGDNPDNAMLWNMSGTGSNLEYLSFGLGDPTLATNEIMRMTGHGVNINSPVNTEAVLNLMDNSTTKMHGIMVSYAGNAPGTRGTFFGLSSLGLNDDAIIWNYRNNAILFGTNNTQRVEISNAGNVGINLAGPAYLLDVLGNTGVNPMRVRGVLTGATSDSLLTISSSGLVRRMKASDMFAATGTDWSTTGNAGTVDGTNFIGTTDNVPFTIRVNNQQAGRIDLDNNTSLGLGADPVLPFSGNKNTAIGSEAMNYETNSNENVAVGFRAMYNTDHAQNLVAIGSEAMGGGVSDVSKSVAVGSQALYSQNSNDLNVAVGYRAMYSTSGSYAVAIGDSALFTNQGDWNTAVGAKALFSTGNVGNGKNTAVGYEAGYRNNGGSNTAVGYRAMAEGNGGANNSSNTAVGIEALLKTNSEDNTAVGYYALHENYSGIGNCALGWAAAVNSTTGDYNIAVGTDALGRNTIGTGSTAVGHTALYFNTQQSYLVAVGDSALFGSSISTGVANTAIGAKTLVKISSGSYNTATGLQALYTATTGSGNTAIGHQSGFGITTGSNNTVAGNRAFATPGGNNSGVVAIGNYALYNTNQDNSVAVGDSALAYNGGAGNTGVGYRALTAINSGFNNTAVGFEAGKANSGMQNITAIGYQALGSSTGGYSNTAVGSRALYSDAGGMYNNALGHEALYTNNTGADNTAVGYHSLYSNTSGSNNTAVGNYAGNGMTNSSNNVAIGYNAMYSTGNVSGSVAIGRAALSSAATYDAVAIGDSALAFNAGAGNTAVGNKTLIANNAGSYNTVLGYEAARRTTGMSYNTALGYQSMGGFAGGVANTSVGAQALYTGNGSSYNAAVGFKAMYSTNGAGDNNAALGGYSLYSNITGRNNTAVGYQAAYSNSTGYSNVAIGKDALYNGSIVRNTVAIGDSALFNNGTTPSASLGQFNTAVGSKALLTNNTGTSNTALGFEALYSNATTSSNTAVGRGALRATTGNYSTAVGSLAASSNTGDGNTAVGYLTLSGNTTGTLNTALGYGANVSGTNLTNATAIGANATVAGSNMMVLGDVGLNAVNVGIGLTNPAQRLHVFNNRDVNKNSIYSDAEQVSTVTDYQNNAIVGYGRGGNATWGYATGVMGIGDQANSFFAIGVYAGLESAVPTLPATDAALYANGANLGYAGIFMNGNVGIGTATPATRLVVTGDGNGKASIGGGFCGGDYTGISLNGLTGNCTVYNMLSSSSDQNLYFNRPTGYAMAFRENNADQMYITSGGNIGIGTTNPGLVKLFVCGDVSINGLLRVSSTVSSSGGFGCPSDIRYKKNITPLNHALANVTKLQGVNYYWKTDEFADKNFTTDRQIGFIAQETEKVYPEMVITDKDGFKMVDYARITPVLVEAIKELNEKNTALEKKIERLENVLAHSGLQQKRELSITK